MTKSLKTQVDVSIVEIEKNDTKPLGSEKELHAAIVSLQSHLGFEEILRRMRVAKAMLQARLLQDAEDSNRHAIRGLINAYSFLERQLKHELGKPVEKPREMYEEEKREYERLSQFVEFVGRGGDAN